MRASGRGDRFAEPSANARSFRDPPVCGFPPNGANRPATPRYAARCAFSAALTGFSRRSAALSFLVIAGARRLSA